MGAEDDDLAEEVSSTWREADRQRGLMEAASRTHTVDGQGTA